jgi:hypothetical protein
VGGLKIIELCTVKLNESSPMAFEGSASSRMSTDALASMPSVSVAKTKNMPALVFFYTQATAENGAGAAGGGCPIGGGLAGGKASNLSKTCRSVELSLFSGRSKSVGLLARSFQCSKVNVTSVTAKQDPVFNAQNAPLVLVTAADGSRVALLSGKVGEADLAAAMQAALRKSGFDGQGVATQGEQVLRQIAKYEEEKNRLRAMISMGGGKQQADNAARVATAKADLEKVEKNLAESYKALDKLVKPT